MAPTLLPATTGPYAVGNRRLFLTDTSRPDPYSNAATRQVPIIAWYPTSTSGPVSKYLSNTDSLDGQMALSLTNGLDGRMCNNFFGSVSCFGVNVAATMYPNIRSRDTRAVLNGAIRTDIGLLPVVLFSPGFGLPGHHSAILAQELASHGYLVLTMTHMWEAIVTELATSVAGQNTSAAANQKSISARVADSRFILNQLPTLPNGIGAQADVNSIAMAGHSYGGYTSLETAYHDARVKAVAVLDGTAGFANTENHAQNNGIQAPVMLLSGDVVATDNYTVGAEHASWNTYAATNHGDLYRFEVTGTRHYAFNDVGLLASAQKQPDLCGPIAPARAMEIHPRMTRAFLDTYIKGAADPLLTTPGISFPEISVI